MKLSLWHRLCFRLRFKLGFRSWMRRCWWSAQGARFGAQTGVPRLAITWPHQLQIGAHCILEDDTIFKFDGMWQPGPSIVVGDRVFIGSNCEFNIIKRMEVGNDCLIASGCRFIDHNHGMALDEPMNVQFNESSAITLEENVWLGVNVVVLQGVTIGRGAIVAAGAVVNKNINENEVWGGVPARKIKTRN